MKNLKETIKLFQDVRNNKTTIVVYNMSPQTLEKLKDVLFAEMVTVTGVECTDPVTHQDTDTTNMTDITPVQAFTPESARQYLITNLPQECYQDPAKQIRWLMDCIAKFGNNIDANLLEAAKMFIKQVSAAALQASYVNGEPQDTKEVLDSLRNILYVTRGYAWDSVKVAAQYGYGDITTQSPEQANQTLQQVLLSMDSNTLRMVVESISK